MKKRLYLAFLLIASISASAQVRDRAVIDKLCGCFEVDFRYAETFSPDPDYKFHDREEIGGTAELALPIEVSDKKVVIQHLLVVSPTMVVKHWREEWVYENPVIWKYMGDRTWVKETLPADQVSGKWMQTVWEVADEPRYQGFSNFAELDGKIVWQNTTDAPLPRREYSVRNDYNILRRTNRLSFGPNGYIHEQDNLKILKKDGQEKILAEEKGWNTYRKIDEKDCQLAKEYWEKNKEYWTSVRNIWNEYIQTRDTIKLENKIEGKMLHEYLIGLSQESTTQNTAETKTKIKETIEKFLK